MNIHSLQTDPDKFEYVEVGESNDLPVGERLFVEVDGIQMVVFNVAGQYYAISDFCSHDDGPLGDGDLNGFEVTCPRHGARFDVRNGLALSLPAIKNIPSYPVRVVEGKLEIGLPVEG